MVEIATHLSGARNDWKEKGACNNNITAKSSTMAQVRVKRDARYEGKVPAVQVACRTICNIYWAVGPDKSGLMNLVQEVRNEYFPRCFFSIRQGGSRDRWQSRHR